MKAQISEKMSEMSVLMCGHGIMHATHTILIKTEAILFAIKKYLCE
jgi:hypothetical protein